MEKYEGLPVWFNGHDLSGYLKVTDLSRNIGTTRTNDLKKSGNSDGKRHQVTTLEEKYISMSFVLRYDLIKKRRELADILNVDEPAELIFGDEQEVYYLALPDGDIDVSEINFLGFGTIDWVVPDGVAHSKEPDVFSSVKEPDFTSQPAKYTAGQTWLVEAGHQVTVTSDYKGKSTGDLVGNPNVAYASTYNSLILPNHQSKRELNSTEYNTISSAGGNSASIFNTTIGTIAMVIFESNPLEIAKRTFHGAFDVLTQDEQVIKLKSIVTKLAPSVWARGYGNGGNKVSFRSFYSHDWKESRANCTGSIAKLTYPTDQEQAIKLIIQSDGRVFNMAHAEPASDGFATSVWIEYFNLVITFNNPHVGKLLRATKSSDTFNMADWELVPPDPNNTAEIDVEYKGTYESYPILKATMTSENGLVAFINSKGKVIQIGDPESVDGFTYLENDKVVHEMMRTQGNWEINKGNIVYPNYHSDPSTPNIIAGDYDWNTVYEHAIPIYADGDFTTWNGSLIRCAVPKNSIGENIGNFQYKAHFMMGSTVRGLGRVHFQLQNGDKVPFAALLRDSNKSVQELVLEIWLNEEIIFSRQLSLKEFTGEFFEIVLERSRTEFTTRINQVGTLKNEVVTATKSFVKTFNFESVKDIPITHISQWAAKFGKSEEMKLEFTDTKFDWVNVEKWQNVPNLFNKGDELILDTSSGEIFVNGIARDDLDVLGSNWEDFFIDGDEKIYCIPSSWAAEPVAEVISRGAWL